ncbi:Ankyrin repeat, ph and sec7 domain containing protein secg-like, partial [Globisporangium splendens]
MLTLAAAHGRAKVVSILCQIKADPRIENAKGWSAVHVAVAYNNTDILESFIALGINVDQPDARLGYTPLHLAASVDNTNVLKYFHDSGKADFMTKAKNGFAVLHVASVHGSEQCVTFLLTKYSESKYLYDAVLHENPAHKAAKHLHPSVYTQLVAHGTQDNVEHLQAFTGR